MLANQGRLQPFFDQPLARPGNRSDTGLKRRCNLAVAPAFTTVRSIGFQQNAGLQQLLCRMFPAMDKGVELLSLRIAECHNVFLYCALFAAHESPPSVLTQTSIQRTRTESMTEATRPYTPKTNGKAERFIQSALREWAYAQPYTHSDRRTAELLRWLHRYNWHRPHGSLDTKPPISRLGLSENNLLRLHI